MLIFAHISIVVTGAEERFCHIHFWLIAFLIEFLFRNSRKRTSLICWRKTTMQIPIRKRNVTERQLYVIKRICKWPTDGSGMSSNCSWTQIECHGGTGVEIPFSPRWWDLNQDEFPKNPQIIEKQFWRIDRKLEKVICPTNSSGSSITQYRFAPCQNRFQFYFPPTVAEPAQTSIVWRFFFEVN